MPGGVSAAYQVNATGVIATGSTFFGQIMVNTAGSGSTLTLNDASGLVTAQTITAITKANPAVVTISTVSGSNPFSVNNTIAFASVGGMVQVNTLVGVVTAIGGSSGAWTVTTNFDSTNFTTYTSGGTAASFSAANQIWSATTLTAGALIPFYWPCSYGLVISSIITSAVLSISFT